MIIVMQLKSLTYTSLWKLNQTIKKSERPTFSSKTYLPQYWHRKKTLILILITFFINELFTVREVCHKCQIIYCNHKFRTCVSGVFTTEGGGAMQLLPPPPISRFTLVELKGTVDVLSSDPPFIVSRLFVIQQRL